MKKLLLGVAFAALMSSSAMAAKIGVVDGQVRRQLPDVLRNGMIAQAKGMSGVELQVEDAQNDVAKQLDQIKNFRRFGGRRDHRQSGRHLGHAGDVRCRGRRQDSAGLRQSRAGQRGHAADNQAFVASNEADSGTLETKEVCRLFKEAGKKEANVYVIMASCRTRPPCSAPRTSKK